jgi:hypothetical protein
MTNEQATTLLKMLSANLMMMGMMCRFLETHPLMERGAFADYVEQKGRDWRIDFEYAIVIRNFVDMLREQGEPQVKMLLQ